ncbi:MAG: hypothetical protein JNM68_08210, partial [Dinghuibacter sp.]|nr:hypothetical protein [Dinghuibacter sp.]
DTCVRQTFQKTYGGAGDEFIQDLRSTPDGGYIATGRTNSFGAGNYDGLVIKYDDKGVVQWTKTYGGAGFDWLYRIKPTGGGYITVGSTGSFGAPVADAWIMKLDNIGNVVWARRFGENTANGEAGTNVIETSDGGFLFSAINNRAGGVASSMLIKLDNNGNTLWSRVYDVGTTDEVSSILEEPNAYVMVGQYNSTTFHDLYLMRVNKTNGAVISSRGYDIDGRNNFGYEIYKINNNFEFIFSYVNDFSPTPANQRTGVLRLDSLGNIIHAKILNASNPTVAGLIYPLNDGSYFAAHSESANSDIHLFKYNSAGIQQFGTKYVTAGEQLCYTANPAADGGYLLGAYTRTGVGAVGDIGIIKTDIVGGTPGCSVQPVTAPLSNIANSVRTVTFFTRATSFVNPTAINIQAVSQNIGSTQLCSGTTCVTPSTDSCSQITFRKSFGGTGDDYLNDVKSTPDGGYVAAGVTTSFGAGNSDGAILKTDNAGNILWTRVIGGAGADYLQRIINTADGGFLAAGYTGSFGATSAQEAWLVKLNAAGSYQWSRKYTDGNPNGSVIWDVCQTSDGGYAFSGVNRYTPGLADAMVGKIDANGVVQWCKSFSGFNSDQGWGILENNGQIIVSSFGVNLGGGAFYDGVLMKLNMANGNVLFARSYEIESRSNWFTYLFKQGGEYLVGCNNTNDYGNTSFGHIVLRVDTATFAVNRIIRSNAPTDRSGAAMFAPLSAGGHIMFESENTTTADAYIRKNSPTGSLLWMKQYGTATTNDRMHSMVEAPDKGFFGGGFYTSGNNRDFLIMKTDAGGNQGGTCTTANATGDNSTPAFSSALFTWPTITNVAINANSQVVPTINSPALTAGINCSGPTCNTLTDTCSVVTFQKVFNAAGDDIIYSTKKNHTSGGYIMAGTSNSNSSGGYDALLVRTTNNGAIAWAKNFGGTGDDQFLKAIQTVNGGFVAVGHTRSFGVVPGAAYMVHTDALGNQLWSRTYRASANGEIFNDVVQTTDGGFALVGTYNISPGTGGILVMKLDLNGNQQWSRVYNSSNNSEEGLSILEEADSLVITAYLNSTSGRDGILMKVNKSNGNIHWVKAYDVNNGSNVFNRIQRVPGGYSIISSSSTGFTAANTKQVAIRTDASGNVVYAHQLSSATNKPYGDRIWFNLNGGYTSTASEESNNGDIHFYSINSNKQPVWKKRFTRPGNQNITDLAQETGGYYYMSGIYNTTAGASNDILFIRTDANGSTQGCTMDSTDMLIGQPVIVPVAYSPSVATPTFTNPQSVTSSVNNVAFAVTELCATATRCDSLNLNGTDSSCNLNDTLTYSVTRSAGCTAPVVFTINPATGVQIISQNDSAIRIRFTQTTQVLLKAR